MMMNKSNLLFTAAGIVSVILIYNIYKKSKTAGKAVARPGSGSNGFVTTIAQSGGWIYYSDGSSVDPQGRYFLGSELIYDPLGMYGGSI